MTDRLPAIDLPNMVAALRSERTEMLDFTRSLTDDEWRAPSAAAGWSIADVVGHIAATAHNFYAPSLEILRTKDLEASNEGPVERRRSCDPRADDDGVREIESTSDLARQCDQTITCGATALLPRGTGTLSHRPHDQWSAGVRPPHAPAPRHGLSTGPAGASHRRRPDAGCADLSNRVAHAPVDGLDTRIALTLTDPAAERGGSPLRWLAAQCSDDHSLLLWLHPEET
jgi:hypothetical protein